MTVEYAIVKEGNSGNASIPYLHPQVHGRAEFWDDENYSIPFDVDKGVAS